MSRSEQQRICRPEEEEEEEQSVRTEREEVKNRDGSELTCFVEAPAPSMPLPLPEAETKGWGRRRSTLAVPLAPAGLPSSSPWLMRDGDDDEGEATRDLSSAAADGWGGE